MINRSQTFKQEPLNIVGSSTFGRYPTISIEKTYNMFMSDGWMVPYAGYKKAIDFSALGNGTEGRALHSSTKLNRLIGVFNSNVYLIQLNFSQQQQKVISYQAIKIGELQTTTGVVYIAENNKPQLLLSDGKLLYLYDTALSPSFQVITTSFIPGFIDFHDTYFLCAASADGFYTPSANNTWRLSDSNNGASWPDDAAHIGLLQTKPDNTQAVVRFPSKGNMIFVFGRTVVEPWFDVGYQLFPYQRNTSFNIDYGCLNPATIASMDELVIWLGINEKGGPVVFYSDGGMPQQITTDGFDYVLSNMQNPQDSQAFIYRQDGHLFYHINFYSDNLSFFVDFLKDGSHKIYHASDERGNYFIGSVVAFFNNQYYFVTKNNGNLYAFDTIFTTYDGEEVPRIRSCKNIRNIQQEPFIANDCGFTIETGNTNYLDQDLGEIYFITEDGKKLRTEGDPIFFETESGDNLITEDGLNLVSEQVDDTSFSLLISEQDFIVHTTPRVDMSISIDGGDHFSSYDAQYLPPIGQRKNKLAWWQLGWSNDLVCQFRFWGMGRFVVTDGYVNTRQ
ncbi:MAG: hypothetical protein PHV62_03220 [Sulfuricurvum sp.]|nr:hypothetical protein [Sulfuricurvum sp.]